MRLPRDVCMEIWLKWTTRKPPAGVKPIQRVAKGRKPTGNPSLLPLSPKDTNPFPLLSPVTHNPKSTSGENHDFGRLPAPFRLSHSSGWNLHFC